MKDSAGNITIDNLFLNRKSVGPKLLEIMKSKGHTKVSFSKLTDINDYILYRNGTGTAQELDKDNDIDNDYDDDKDNVGYKSFQVKRKQLLGRSY